MLTLFVACCLLFIAKPFRMMANVYDTMYQNLSGDIYLEFHLFLWLMIARDRVWPTMSQRSLSKGGLGRKIWQTDTQYLIESMSERETGKVE